MSVLAVGRGVLLVFLRSYFVSTFLGFVTSQVRFCLILAVMIVSISAVYDLFLLKGFRGSNKHPRPVVALSWSKHRYSSGGRSSRER